ncbi:restriction endonuclease subunit S [Psittacicella hinzii]|uniref:Type I restriction modification DNA specificity domain-containing protein n=1 Tax=Psittacicella hinzii TaxID=2028575 RepID=A0A3A1YQK0_9GAMM|nr:restriction endonuclease subunit S [Psittacicella hinzii]RIY38634.1 hypothetical protein CKF58_03780 [Psittacicella hinzii]
MTKPLSLRFSGFTTPWQTKPLCKWFTYGKAGGTPKSSQAVYYANGEIPFLNIADMTAARKYIQQTEKHITQEGLDSCAAWLVPAGAINFAMYASVGKITINQVPVATSQAIFKYAVC